MTSIPRYYTRQEAANLLGVTPQRISVIAKTEKWKRRRVGRSWLYRKKSVRATLAKRARREEKRRWRKLVIQSE